MIIVLALRTEQLEVSHFVKMQIFFCALILQITFFLIFQ